MQLGAGVTRCSFTARPSGSFPFLIATTLGLPCWLMTVVVLISTSATSMHCKCVTMQHINGAATRASFDVSHPGSHGVAPCSIARPSFRWQDRQFIAAASSNGTAGDSGDGKRKEEQSNNVWENLKVGPLKYASSLHNVNKQYLRIRRRRKWWGRMQFPKVGLYVMSKPLLHTGILCSRCM